MTKHLLVVNFETTSPIMSWEILPGDRDVRHFLNICLDDIRDARVTGFVCQRLDGQDLTCAIENSQTISEGAQIAELLAIPS